MSRTLQATAVLFLVVWVSAMTLPARASGRAQGTPVQPMAPLLKHLGTLHHKVTTQSDRAQVFFDQGLRLVYGFNHFEAIRSFKEAARLDPECGMAYWGVSLALGPNVNDPITPEREAEAYAALQKAIALKPRLTEIEGALIDALRTRYSTEKAPDRKAYDRAYARAMEQVAARYPNDPEANTLYAASIMETRPWEYWTKDSVPQPGIPEAVATLEKVIREFPDHPGAHHFYIHVVEASSRPERGVASADKLESLMPGAGHLVHMPAHIYMRVGRYADAIDSNVRAAAADEDYISQCQAQGLYPTGYYPHNIHFLWSAAAMDGRAALAIDGGRKVAAKMHHETVKSAVVLQDFQATPYFALVRFGRWEEMLTEGQPSSDLPYTTAMWRYGRGMALSGRGQFDLARQELGALHAFVDHKALQGVDLANTPLISLVELASKVLSGDIAARQRRFDEAIALLQEAVAMQDAQRYNEPATWYYPVRHSLGAVLLDAGRFVDAEAVYREDLKRNPENGWALFGLMKSLDAQKRADEAASTAARFRRAWSRSDVTLTASRF